MLDRDFEIIRTRWNSSAHQGNQNHNLKISKEVPAAFKIHRTQYTATSVVVCWFYWGFCNCMPCKFSLFRHHFGISILCFSFSSVVTLPETIDRQFQIYESILNLLLSTMAWHIFPHVGCAMRRQRFKKNAFRRTNELKKITKMHA